MNVRWTYDERCRRRSRRLVQRSAASSRSSRTPRASSWSCRGRAGRGRRSRMLATTPVDDAALAVESRSGDLLLGAPRRLPAHRAVPDGPRRRATGPSTRASRAPRRPALTVEGRDVINFGSNNYLSLSYHPEVIEATIAATRHFGTGVTGSRLLNGTLTLHRELEAELADFYGREAALVFSTGYVANVAAIAGFLGRGRLRRRRQGHPQLAAHAASACRGASMKRFRHNDLEHLEKVLAGSRARGRQGHHRRRRLLDGRRHRAARPPRRAVPRDTRTRSSSTTRPTASACSASAVSVPREQYGVARRRRPHHDHLLEDARVVRRRADRRTQDAIELLTLDLRHVHLHGRRTRPDRSPPRSRRSGSCAREPERPAAAARERRVLPRRCSRSAASPRTRSRARSSRSRSATTTTSRRCCSRSTCSTRACS